jgi:hypothetical protein
MGMEETIGPVFSIIDVEVSGSKIWKTSHWVCFDYCRCDVIIHLFDDAQKVTIEEGVCMCGAQLVNVEYKQVSLKETAVLCSPGWHYSVMVGRSTCLLLYNRKCQDM